MMKVIVNFGEKKVVVPCGTHGDLSIRELIQSATAKYCKLSASNPGAILNSEQVQLRLNNGAVVDPDDRVGDVVDDREELFTIINHSRPSNLNSNGELSSSMTSSNLSSSLSDHERPGLPPPPPKIPVNHRHEVVVTDADLRTRSLRIKTESNNNHQENMINRIHHQQKSSPRSQLLDQKTMYQMHIDENTGEQTFYIALPRENSPLGIHVIPFNPDENRVNGLLLQNIEPDGRVKRQGVLEVNDRIVEINRINVEHCSFEKAQMIFRNALLEPELELRIVRNGQRTSPGFFLNHPNEFNQHTRRMGKILKITLTKGHDGLGFKLASRDNPTGTANPIYVKTIFPKGAAIEDGRLRNGDRLLMVNSIDVTQMSLQETVGVLRETRVGETVHLCVSRQQDGSLPKDLLNEDAKTQLITFDIPLRDTSSAGLGITLKGKTSIIDGQSMDLGIYVKSVLTGGAAYRDNRLRPNDQILVINDCSLVNLTNLEAANILHDAVRKEIQPGYITITISRDEQDNQSKNVRETELLPPPATANKDENELDLTDFVPSVSRKTPINDSDVHCQTPLAERQKQEEMTNGNVNPFERETPFRQSVSEKRRLTQQANPSAVQWKQQSFHETRTNSERRQPSRVLADSTASNLIRSSSYESIHQIREPDEQKRSIKSRHRACNDSFRQAVDKSYGQNNHHENGNGERSSKAEKSKFKFTNIFTTKSKRKENQEDRSSSMKSPMFYPPPPPAFSSQPLPPTSKSPHNERISTNFPTNQQQCYQPYRFDANHLSKSPRHEPQIIPSRISSTVHHQKSSHPPIPRQFLQSNITGTQSLKQHQPSSRPSALPSASHIDFSPRKNSINPPRSYLHFENPANV